MTGNEALAVHAEVQALLRRQAALLNTDGADLDQAELLSTQISRLIESVPSADRLTDIDQAMRARLLATAQLSLTELAVCTMTFDQLRRQQLDDQARFERDGTAARHYLPPAENSPAHFLDERR
jgi:hypothetical protein